MIADGNAEADKIRALPTPSEEEKKKLTEYDVLTTSQLVKNKSDEEAAKKDYETSQSTTKEREQALWHLMRQELLH